MQIIRIFICISALSLFPFLSQKEQVSLKFVSFLTHANNHNKSTTLADCAFDLCRVPEKRRTNGKLYTNGKHDFFSLTSRGLRQVFEHLGPTSRTPGRSCHNGKRGNIYPQMREYGNATCHSLVCTAFHGPRPIVNGILYVCDHKKASAKLTRDMKTIIDDFPGNHPNIAPDDIKTVLKCLD